MATVGEGTRADGENYLSLSRDKATAVPSDKTADVVAHEQLKKSGEVFAGVDALAPAHMNADVHVTKMPKSESSDETGLLNRTNSASQTAKFQTTKEPERNLTNPTNLAAEVLAASIKTAPNAQPQKPINPVAHYKESLCTKSADVLKPPTPGMGFLKPEDNDKFGVAIQKRVNTDKEDVVSCISGGHVSKLRGTSEQASNAKSACSAMRSSYRELFTDPTKFEEKWNAFITSERNKPEEKSCLADLKKDPGKPSKDLDPEIDLIKPVFDLKVKGYHNNDHANEMYADTVVKLKKEGVSDSLCVAGGTMAYFHDLVQGLDGFPGTGKNENVTAKFLNFLIDEQVRAGTIDKETGDSLKHLSDATIVGGTLLVPLMGTPTGNRNITPEECIDNSELKSLGNKDYEDLSKIREAMAKNDISRTQDPAYTEDPDPDGSKSKLPGEVGRCYHAKSEAFKARSKAINENPASVILKEAGLPTEHIARTCQSIRMLAEIKGKPYFDKKKGAMQPAPIKEQAIVEYFRTSPENRKRTPEYEENLGKFRAILQDPITWAGGKVDDEFKPGEAQFALPSNHKEYSEAIKAPSFTNAMKGMEPKVVDSLIELALRDIQDGRYIRDDLEPKKFANPPS